MCGYNICSNYNIHLLILVQKILCRWTLAYTICDVLQAELDDFVQNWNSHPIRQSRADCIGGVPEDLYDMPQIYGNDYSTNLTVLLFKQVQRLTIITLNRSC